MLGFSLLSDDTLYKAVKITKGSYVNRKWVEGTITSYESFLGDWEPHSDGEETITLPQGVSSTNSILIYSQEELSVASDLKGYEEVGDIIYLEDPEDQAEVPPYRVIAKEVWKANASFTLLQGHILYLAVRQEKK